MAVDTRVVAISAGLAIVLGGALMSPALFPQAFADEPQSHILDTAKELFPAPKFDPKTLRKYDIDLDEDQVSTEVTHRDTVTKIAFGQRTVVSVVTTPTGTYSTDGLVSPYVRYPGVDVSPNPDCTCRGWGHPKVAVGVSTTPYGTYKWQTVTSGSFIYYNSSFERTRRH
jgi:hypothetical protein